MRVVDRRRHQQVGLVGGIAEHQPLVAGPLGLLALTVDALIDVPRLFAQGHQYATGVTVETDLGVVVTDLVDDLPDHLLVVDLPVGVGQGDLPGQHDEARLHQGLAGHPRLGVVGIAAVDLVQYGIGDLIRHLVRMALGN